MSPHTPWPCWHPEVPACRPQPRRLPRCSAPFRRVHLGWTPVRHSLQAPAPGLRPLSVPRMRMLPWDATSPRTLAAFLPLQRQSQPSRQQPWPALEETMKRQWHPLRDLTKHLRPALDELTKWPWLVTSAPTRQPLRFAWRRTPRGAPVSSRGHIPRQRLQRRRLLLADSPLLSCPARRLPAALL